MARWSEFVAAEPEFARQVRARFAVDTPGTVATLRRDGSPRIGGINPLLSDGDLFLTEFFLNSVRAADLRRDPRLALHSANTNSNNEDMSDWPGEAKIAGYGIETVIDADQGWLSAYPTTFRVDIIEVVRIYLDLPDHFVIESWHEGRGLRRHAHLYPPKARVEAVNYWMQKNELLETE